MHFAKHTKYASEQICKHPLFGCRIRTLHAEASVLCMPKHPFSQAVLFSAQCHCHAFCQANEVCQRANMQASALWMPHPLFGCPISPGVFATFRILEYNWALSGLLIIALVQLML
jgi:hypothetical protein